MIYDSLDDEERLVEIASDWAKRCQDDDAQHAEGCYSRCFLLLADDWDTEDNMIVNPKGAMHCGTNEHATSCPPVYIIQFLITMTRSKQQRKNGVLRCK